MLLLFFKSIITPSPHNLTSASQQNTSTRVCLECNPEIPVTPGEEQWLLDTSLDEVYWPCSHSVVSNSLQSHGLQHARFPCSSLSPGICSNSCQLSQWCHPTISPSVSPFSSCPQSFPASGSFPKSQLFASGGKVMEFWSFSFSNFRLLNRYQLLTIPKICQTFSCSCSCLEHPVHFSATCFFKEISNYFLAEGFPVLSQMIN